jgi:glutamine synthetase
MTKLQIAQPQEAEAFFSQHPTVDAVDIIFTNMCGVPRGKRLRQHETLGVYREGRFLPRSAVVIDTTGRDTVETGLVWEHGDADGRVHPVPGTLRPAPWAGDKAAQFISSFYGLDGAPDELDPRHVLASVVDRMTVAGYVPDVAVELEFYLMDARRGRDGRPRPARGPNMGARPNDIQVYGLQEMEDFRGFFDEVYACADAMGLPLEAAISEYAPGQFEVTLAHKADPLAACDDAILYKRMLKAVAQKHGYEATFMAKPFADCAGSGTHLHASLLDADGKNAFASEDPQGTPLLRHAIAGMQATMADAFLIFAPNANSYRRFRANSYAPVAPSWGVNNRTVSFRVTAGAPATRHLEHRIAGADTNPYLAMAAMLAGMHHGIVNALDPGAPVSGNGYDADPASTSQIAAMPTNWFEAVAQFSRSALMQDYLGAKFVEMYSIVKRTEQELFTATVPDLDYDWYLRTA